MNSPAILRHTRPQELHLGSCGNEVGRDIKNSLVLPSNNAELIPELQILSGMGLEP